MVFPITIELGSEGGTYRFGTVDDLKVFVNEETNAWAWTAAVDQLGNLNSSLNMMSVTRRRFIDAMNAIKTSLNQENSQNAEALLHEYFNNTILPFSGSPAGKFLIQTAQDINAAAGIGALCTLRGWRFDGDDSHQVRGAMLAHELMQGTGKTARKAVQDALSGMLDRYGQMQTHAQERADALESDIVQLKDRRQRQFISLLREGEKARKKFAGNIDESVGRISVAADMAISDLRAVQGTYEEFMRLKAPVTYWRGKASSHTNNARIAGVLGLAFAIAVIFITLRWGVDYVMSQVKLLVAETHQWQSAYIVLTMALFLVTVLFWIGRLISRTYVSQVHLAIDAEERATMVETYLALTKDNSISNAERILVLGSLFRASSDGFVKDDGAPDIGLASWASRFAGSGGEPR